MSMETINCVLLDDDPRALDRMESLLQMVEGVLVMSKFSSVNDAMMHLPQLGPDLLFLDVEMPGMSGFELLKEIHKQQCYPGVIFVTGYDRYAIKAIKAEAFDYLVKPLDIDELKASLRRFKEKKQSNYLQGFGNLSDREKEILQLVAQGKTSREIGELLFISKHTVDTHRRNIQKKTSGIKK